MTLFDASMMHDFPDRALRAALADPKNLRDFLVMALPDLAPKLDILHAKRIEPTFTLEDWRHREADLLFEIPYAGADGPPVLVCLMVEHQSKPDRCLPMRMLIYASLYWDQEWKEYEKDHTLGEGMAFSAVVPVVFHTGPTLWNTTRTVGELFRGPAALQAYAALWPIAYWDLAARTPEELLGEEGPFAQLLAVVRTEREDYERFRDVFVEAMRRLESIADDDRMRWHELLHILLSWVVQRRSYRDRESLLELATESQRSQAHKREVEMERATMEQTGAEWMYQKIQKEVEEKLGKEYREKFEKEYREKLDKEYREKLEKELAAREKAIREKEMAAKEPTAWRKVLLGLLADRFGPLPDSVTNAVNACEDVDRLQSATRKSITLASLEEFVL